MLASTARKNLAFPEAIGLIEMINHFTSCEFVEHSLTVNVEIGHLTWKRDFTPVDSYLAGEFVELTCASNDFYTFHGHSNRWRQQQQQMTSKSYQVSLQQARSSDMSNSWAIRSRSTVWITLIQLEKTNTQYFLFKREAPGHPVNNARLPEIFWDTLQLPLLRYF